MTMPQAAGFWWVSLPQSADSGDPPTPRCGRCGSRAIAVRANGPEVVIGCKDCGRAICHHDRAQAWRCLDATALPESEFDRRSLAAVDAILKERHAEGS